MNIAVVTNCHLPRDLFKNIDYLIPISTQDLLLSAGPRQFTTRMIYNRFPPFQYSLVLDAHTCWCDNRDAEEVFSLFKAGDVDLAFSTRVLNRWITSGFAVLYRYNQNTFNYWSRIVEYNMLYNLHGDDQYAMRIIARESLQRKELSFRWLSNNWFFAAHGVSEEGAFVSGAECYRSSVLVNGRVRFIHGGGTAECELVNGVDNANAQRLRTLFVPQKCSFSSQHASQLVYSQQKMEALAAPHTAPAFNWTLLSTEDPDGLFWYADKGFG